jgi:hypothetical protein
MKQLNGVGKGILLGGTFGGVISLIPFINFFNIIFMMWMGVGGFLGVYLLKKENQAIKAFDAALIGALSGITGGIIFGTVTTLAIINISDEKIEKMLGLAEKFSTLLKQDLTSSLENINIKAAFFSIIIMALIFSVIYGAAGGMISRFIFFPGTGKKREDD